MSAEGMTEPLAASVSPTEAAREGHERLSIAEKVGYATGDLAANLIFQTLMTFLAYFYTDIYDIPTGTATLIISTVGIVAAVAVNPIVGALADRTTTRWGRFRPWVLWTAVPFGLISVLAFRTPDISPEGKVAYAFVTYSLLLIIYAANNLPYAALSGVLTGNMSERNSLSSYRFVAVMIAQFVIQVLLYPIVDRIGNGDKAAGFAQVMGVLAVVGSALLLVTFFSTKERVKPSVEQHTSVAQDLKDLAANRPWLVMLTLTTLVFVTLALKGGLYIYYFENCMSEASIRTFLHSVGLTQYDNPAAYVFGIFNGCGIIFMIVGIGFSKGLADRYGKRDVFGVALLISTTFVAALLFIPADEVAWVFGAQVLHGFFYGITIPILWAMIADVADFSEWKTGRRATGIIFSAMMVGLKLGLTFGQTILTAALGLYGYDASLEIQPPEAVAGIRLTVSVWASVPFLLGCGLLFLYEIDKPLEQRLERELRERRSAAVPSAAS